MRGAALTPGDELNLDGTGIALILCLGALIACIDLPRPEQEERFPGALGTCIRTAAGEGDSRFVNIAADGALMEGGGLFKRLHIGQLLEVYIDPVGWLPAHLAGAQPCGAELRFAGTEAQREHLVSHVFNVPAEPRCRSGAAAGRPRRRCSRARASGRPKQGSCA